MLGVLQPLFGAFVILAIAVAFSNNRRAINWTTVAWGLGLQVVFALIVLKTTIGQRVFATLGAGINKLLGFAGVGAAFVFGPLGDSERLGPRDERRARRRKARSYAVIFAFQVLPTIIFIAALFAILYYYGVMQLVVRLFAVVMHRVMKCERRRVAERRRQHLHGADRSAADHPPVPAGDDRVGADDGDDLRDGAHLGRHHGRLHPVRHRGEAPADGGDHDRARHDHDGQDAGARNRSAEDDGDGEARGRADRRQRHRRGGARHRRRAAAGAERRRDADLVPRADRAGQLRPRLRRPQPAADLRLGVRAGGLEHGRAVARRAGRSATCSARGWR